MRFEPFHLGHGKVLNLAQASLFLAMLIISGSAASNMFGLQHVKPQRKIQDGTPLTILTGAPVSPKEKDEPKNNTASEVETIDYRKARDFLDKTVAVEFTVQQTRNIGKICFLNPDNKRDFAVPIFSDAFKDQLEKPEEHYLHKKIRVTGKITLYKEKAQIEVHDLKQIVILEEPGANDTGNTAQKPLGPADFNAPRIKPDAAADHGGKAVVIEGIIEHLKKKNGDYVLDFGEFPADEQLTLVIPKDIVKQFPRDPEALFLYQHVLVSGQIESVKNKPVIRIHQTDQLRFDRQGEKLAKAEVVSVSKALERHGKYVGVKGEMSSVEETELFYLVLLREANGASLRVAVDKACLNPKQGKTLLEKPGTIFYGKIDAERKAAPLIIGDAREIVAEPGK